MTPDELRTAAEQVLWRAEAVLNDDATPLMVNAVTLAKAYLADDAEPVTPVWLYRAGDESNEFWVYFKSGITSGPSPTVVIRRDLTEAQLFDDNDRDADALTVPVPKTIGQLRALCRGLGITAIGNSVWELHH